MYLARRQIDSFIDWRKLSALTFVQENHSICYPPSPPPSDKMKYFYLSVDTPDPYVKLFIRTAPNGKKRTKVKNNTANPVWEETLQFYLDQNVKNILGKQPMVFGTRE